MHWSYPRICGRWAANSVIRLSSIAPADRISLKGIAAMKSLCYELHAHHRSDAGKKRCPRLPWKPGSIRRLSATVLDVSRRKSWRLSLHRSILERNASRAPHKLPLCNNSVWRISRLLTLYLVVICVFYITWLNNFVASSH